MKPNSKLTTTGEGWAILPSTYQIDNFIIQNTVFLSQNVAAGSLYNLCFWINNSNKFLVIKTIRLYATGLVPSIHYVGLEAKDMALSSLVGRVGIGLRINRKATGVTQIGKNVAKGGEEGYFNAPQLGVPDQQAGFQFLGHYNTHDDIGPIALKPRDQFQIQVETYNPLAGAEFPPDGIIIGASVEGYMVPVATKPYKDC